MLAFRCVPEEFLLMTRKKSAAAPGVTLPVVVERIERRILLIRGQKVMLDDALAELYRV